MEPLPARCSLGARKGTTIMEAWEYCNSLRYGFDDTYDPPLFDDEDNHPREEK